MGGLFSSPSPAPAQVTTRIDTSELNSLRQDMTSQLQTATNRVDTIQQNVSNLQKAIDDLKQSQTRQNTSFSTLQQSINQLSSMYANTPIGPSSMYYINPFTNARRIDSRLAIQEPTQPCLLDTSVVGGGGLPSSQGSQYILYAPEQKLNELMALTSNQILYMISKTPSEILPFVYKLSGLTATKQPILQQLSSVSPTGNEVFQDVSPSTSTYTDILSILESKYYGYLLQPCKETYSTTPVPRFLSMNASTPVFRKAVIGRSHRYA